MHVLVQQVHQRELTLQSINQNLKDYMKLHGLSGVAVQAVLLYLIDDSFKTAMFTQSQVRKRQLYVGTNIFYNLRVLIREECILSVQCETDRRSNLLMITEKGRYVCRLVEEFFELLAQACGGAVNLDSAELQAFIGRRAYWNT